MSTVDDDIWDDMLETGLEDWTRVIVNSRDVLDFPGYESYQIKNELLEWAKVFIPNFANIRIKAHTTRTRLWFRHKEDAMVFKLAWGGK